ncbi:DUF938 domain-containing protein [Piscinibacter sakaiensis]|uniref:DUF938 domain-containing protein n=1 Tax=Piscinibacter sakaiensis TaxID=1547922 RepID=UPI003AAC5156
MTRADDPRQYSPAADRNREPILNELQRLLPPAGLMLEIASGTGQHAAAFSEALPGWHWQPTDADESALRSIAAWCSACDRVRKPLLLDVTQSDWPGVPAEVDAIYCANMIHISPPETTVGLLQGAARHLRRPDGLLITYGPYIEDGVTTAPSNLQFDLELKRRNPAWGLRRREDVERVAGEAGLELRERVPMPANNLLLLWGWRAS